MKCSIEIGKHQLMTKEYERQKEQNEQEGTSEESDAGRVEEAHILELNERIKVSKDKIRDHKKSIAANSSLKKKLKSELKTNENEMELIR